MPYNYTTDVEFDYLFKILIIGDAGVGKTAILQRFSQDYFATDYVATIGVDFQIRTIEADSKRCKLQVWDTAGQDRFKCVVSSFYRGAHGVMICFDITDLDSFRNVDNWFEEIKRYCPEQTPIFLVGTKSDLQSKRMIPYSTIKAYVEKKNLSYVETIQHTNTLEATHKKPQPPTPNVDLSGRTKPIRDGSNSGCFGGNSCTI